MRLMVMILRLIVIMLWWWWALSQMSSCVTSHSVSDQAPAPINTRFSGLYFTLSGPCVSCTHENAHCAIPQWKSAPLCTMPDILHSALHTILLLCLSNMLHKHTGQAYSEEWTLGYGEWSFSMLMYKVMVTQKVFLVVKSTSFTSNQWAQ